MSAHTSVNVFRIAAIAIAIGISTAGSVPNTNSRITSAPTTPITTSSSTPVPPASPFLLASASGSRPVTFTLISLGSPAAAACRVAAAPLGRSKIASPGG